MANQTLTYSEQVKGWPSFYSFYPEWMVAMNNFFYTFKGGNLYRHNSNSERNTFYKDWWTRQGLPSSSFTETRIQSVINDGVLENKLFKTIDLQGDSTWDIQLETDLQNSGYIQNDWFVKKEAVYFAFVRNNSTGQLSLRSLNGIGNSTSAASVSPGVFRVNFSVSPLIDIGSIISIGDYLYFGSSPLLGGKVTAVNVNLPAGINNLTVDTTIPGTTAIPTTSTLFMYIKNSVAESHGVLGHYCKFSMQNSMNSKIELFAVESEIMKSFP